MIAQEFFFFFSLQNNTSLSGFLVAGMVSTFCWFQIAPRMAASIYKLLFLLGCLGYGVLGCGGAARFFPKQLFCVMRAPAQQSPCPSSPCPQVLVLCLIPCVHQHSGAISGIPAWLTMRVAFLAISVHSSSCFP